MKVPNLDNFATPGRLRLYAMKLQRRMKRMTYPRRCILWGVYNWLYQYARNKADAMEAHRGGFVQDALALEATCEALYQRLPEKVRWR